jgi:hypothetical protein
LDYDVEGTVERMVFKGMQYVRTVEGFSELGKVVEVGSGSGSSEGGEDSGPRL